LGSIQVTIVNMFFVFCFAAKLFFSLSTGTPFIFITLGSWITTGFINVN
jgi:hypothetical protein